MNSSLIFGDIEMTKREFYDSKKAILLNSVDINSIAVNNKVKENNETSKYFIGYLGDISKNVALLCIILPQMSAYIKYFENGGKNNILRFGIKIKNCWVLNFILNQFMMTKFSNIIKTFFSGDEIPKERVEYACVLALVLIVY